MKKNSFVTAYINPDSDAVCAAIGYQYLTGNEFTPAFSGELDKESRFILNHFNWPHPNFITDAIQIDEICLVDTNNVAQLPSWAHPSKVIEIVDHHPDGTPEKFMHAKIQNEKVGAACTLISERVLQKNAEIPFNIAGILSLGIVSNTLNFVAPSTSVRDTETFEKLQKFCRIESDIIQKMFQARSSIVELSSNDIVNSGLKKFNIGGVAIGISQHEIAGVSEIVNRMDFIDAIRDCKRQHDLRYLFFSGVDIVAKTTTIVVPDRAMKIILDNILEGPFPEVGIKIFTTVMQRKTDLIPPLETFLSNHHD